MSNITAGFPASPDIAKAQAKRLRAALKPDNPIGHSHSLELVARLHGEPSWGRMNSLFSPESSLIGAVAPNGPVSPPQERAEDPILDTPLDQRGLSVLRAGLMKARRTELTATALAQAKELLRDEILSVESFHSWFDRLGVSFDDMVLSMGYENFAKFLKIETTTRFSRPNEGGIAMGLDGIRPSAFAATLIRLDLYGFDTHPEVFIDSLLSGIKKARYIDQNELDCLWYKPGKYRFFRESWFDAGAENNESKNENFTMPNGTKVSVQKSPGELGRIHRITLSRG